MWRAVAEAILNPRIVLEQVAQLIENAHDRVSENEQERLEFQESLKQLEAEEGRVLEAYRTGILPVRLFGQELEKIKARRSFLESTKPNLMRPVELLPGRLELKRHITEYCNRAAARLSAFSDEERQRFLRVLLQSVVFEGSRVRIRGRIPVSQNAQMQCPEGTRLQVSDNDPARQDHSEIAATTIWHYGRNTASDFQDIRDVEETIYFPFELERPIVRTSPQADNVGELAA